MSGPFRFLRALNVRRRRSRSKPSIQLIITSSFTMVTLLVILMVSAILYTKFTDTAERNAFLSNGQIVEQIKYNLEMYLQGVDLMFTYAEGKIRKHGGLPGEALTEQLGNLLDTRGDIVSVALFTAEGERMLAFPDLAMRRHTDLAGQSWFRSAIESPDHLTMSLPHIQNLYKGQYKWVVSMSKGITIRRGEETIRAVLLVDVNFKTINDLCSRVSLGKKGYVYIIDESAGNVVYHPQQQLIYSGLKYENVEPALKYTFGNYADESGGEKRLITIQTVNNIGWKIIGVSYMDDIVTTRKDIGAFISWLLLFVIVFVLLVSAFMSARISRPIQRLERSMRQVEQGVFDIPVEVRGDDEVGRLSRRFNLMVGRIAELMEQNIREQEAKRRGELEVLQAQINPHFLYNTLNSVVRLAGVGKSEEVIRMITSLSKFFRISLSKGKLIIPLRDELEHVRHYLIIQDMRYKNKFVFRLQAEDEVLDCPTLKLIVQPIVENAIYHGMELMAGDGFIEITAERIEGRVRIRIADNGPGMAPEKLAGLLASDANADDDAPGSGVGLKNVHERIRLQFGEDYGVTVASQLEEGTTVDLWIPLGTPSGEKADE